MLCLLQETAAKHASCGVGQDYPKPSSPTVADMVMAFEGQRQDFEDDHFTPKRQKEKGADWTHSFCTASTCLLYSHPANFR